MDAVILAAGRGERLRDLAPAFHKPLLPIDGTPLVCRAVDLAYRAGVEWPVVVVAPQNAEIISSVLGPNRPVVMIVQRQEGVPQGPGHALMVGLQAHTRPASSERVLVLLADNVTQPSDVTNVAQHKTAVGVKSIPRGDAGRFTRYEDGRWVEKVPVFPRGDDVLCWVGPFVGWRANMERVLHTIDNERAPGHAEMLIGPYLGDFMFENQHHLVEVSSYDVGTLGSYPKDGITR